MDVRQYAPRKKAPRNLNHPDAVVPLGEQLGLGPRKTRPKRPALNEQQAAKRMRKLARSLLSKI